MTPVVAQTPVYAQTYTPGYASGPVYSGPVYGDSTEEWELAPSAMLGGVAGMFGGILVGQALSNGEYHGYHGGDTGFGGGEEFGGDF
ncbi:hypothetical protein GN244_ATG18470 [Phytophthora infestans]|uniref:Uncharacterized protein n=1 Tax=Phytophthora infestans TaxID=4787 RepID=A0A833SWK8_PHYIN|nr:hypothetical protein GN244_ATG18470 [Phytophthora infestans]